MIDVLIIGSGGAGLTAALEAKKNSNSVVVLSKTYPTQSQTCQAQGGINGVLNKENSDDSTQKHLEDTIKSAHNIGCNEAIEYLCTNSTDTIKWLDDIGVPFSKDENNNIAQRKLGGASNPRACYSSDYTGLKILHTLYDNARKENIEFINEHMLLNFIVEDAIIKGITALDIKTSEVKQILAKTVIVASGGYGALYHGHTTNSSASTGDAVAAALRVGCKVSSMEYVQFHPTSLKPSCVLVSESARGEGGYLVVLDENGDEKRFIDELLPRDIVSRAIYEKMQNNEEVYLDLRHLGLEKIKESMPQEYDLVAEFAQLKLDQDLIPIIPSAHYTMGGIKTNMYGKTNIENLYAVGECSSNGVHGANRLGGNSLLEIVTFGKLVANEAVKNIDNIVVEDKEYEALQKDKNYLESIYKKENSVDFYKIKDDMGDTFYNKVGLFRDDESLNEALSFVKSSKEQLDKMGINDKSEIYNTNLKEYIEFENLLDIAHCVVVSAKQRCESRGAHYRSDFPDELKEFEKDIVVVKTSNDIDVELV